MAIIHGIGTDLVRIARLERVLARRGEAFARRILAEEEFRDFATSTAPARFLAKRFAAKEATAKAFGTGIRDGLRLAHIEVIHDTLGRPGLRFHGRAVELIERFGIGEAHLSITDEADLALAFVTLVRSS